MRTEKINAIYLERIYHPFTILVLSLWVMIAVLANFSLLLFGPVFISTMFLFIHGGLKAKPLFKIVLIISSLSITLFILSILYPSATYKVGREWRFLNNSIIIYQAAIQMAVINFQKIFILSIISMSASLLINYDDLLLFIATTKLPFEREYKDKISSSITSKVSFCYILMAAFRSISLLKEERERILMVMKFRKVNSLKTSFLLFPLIIFAIKHSQRAALALLSRGLSNDKTFYFSYHFLKEEKRNLQILSVFLLIYYVGMRWFMHYLT